MNNILLRNFLQLNLGYWLTLRTSYFTAKNIIHLHKSNILFKTHKNGLYNCSFNQLYINRKKIDKKTTSISYSTNKSISTLDQRFQKIYDWTSFLNKSNHISYVYHIKNFVVFEQSWLVNSNLRLSINTVYKRGKCICVSFSSDIKIV